MNSCQEKQGWFDTFLFALGICLLGLGAKYWYTLELSLGDLSKLRWPDEYNYYLPAAQMIQEQGLKFFLTPRSLWNGPLNPLWIALWNCNIPLVKILNLILISIAGLFVYDLGKRLEGPRTGALACFFYTIYPPFFLFSGTLLTEPVFVFLLIFCFWLFVVSQARHSFGFLLSGIVMALATLTRPTVQLYPFFVWFLIGMLLLFSGMNRKRLKTILNLRAWVWFLVGFLLLVAPFLAKNQLVLDKFGIANGFGAVLYLGNDLRRQGDEPVYLGFEFDTSEVTRDFTHLDTEGDSRLTKVALQRIRAFPLDTLGLSVRKVFRYLFGSAQHYFYPYRDLVSYLENSTSQDAIFRFLEIFLTVSVVVLFSAYILSLRSWQIGSIFMLTLVGYLTALHAVVFAIPRLALPMFPFLSLGAGAFLSRLSSFTSSAWKWCLAIIIAAIIGFISFHNLRRVPGEVTDRFVQYYQISYEVDFMGSGRSSDLVKSKLSREGANTWESTGADPHLVFEIPEVELEKNQVLFIKLQAFDPGSGDLSGPNKAQLFWRKKGQAVFHERRSMAFDIKLDGKNRVYMINPSDKKNWNGTLAGLRLDFPDGLQGATYRVDYLKIAK